MSESILPPPSLLAITATPSPTRRADEPSGFAEEFASASNELDSSEKPSPEAAETPAAESGDRAEATSDQADSAKREPAAEAAEEGSGAIPEENEPTDGLLAVAIAHETIVAETSPTAELPTEASTSFDIHSATLAESGPPNGETLALETGAAVEPLSPEQTDNTDQAASPELAATDTAVEATEVLAAQAGSAVEAKRGESLSVQAAESPSDQRITPIAPDEDQGSDASLEGDAQEEEVARATKPSAGASLPTTTTASAAAPLTADEPDNTSEATEPTPTAKVDSATTTGERPSGLTARLEATAPAAPEPTPEIDPARFVSRVARAFDLAQQRGGGPIEMRLSPPELGSLQVRLEVKEGVLTATMETETQAARNALLDNLPALRDRLAEQQIRVEKFDVDVRDESRQDQGETRPDGEDRAGREREEDRPTRPQAERRSSGADAATTSPIPSPAVPGDDGINLVA